ncbi:MAG: hypothetical protein AAF329_15330 [Cyanobacteria bacterium P01_A01_bin.17]
MTVEQILDLARDLSPMEQQKLLVELQSIASGEHQTSASGGYSSLLNLAGSAHSDDQDVSENKQQHLGEIYGE